MSTETLIKTKEEVNALLEEAEGVLDEMSNTLSTVEVRVTNKSPDIIKAIASLFGKDQVRADGSAVITYSMFNQVNKMLRSAGKLKVKEYV